MAENFTVRAVIGRDLLSFILLITFCQTRVTFCHHFGLTDMKIYKPYREIYKSLCKQDVVELRRKLADISKEIRKDHVETAQRKCD